MVWKINTKDLFSEASGTCGESEDQRGRGDGEVTCCLGKAKFLHQEATGPLWNCPEKGRQVKFLEFAVSL